MQLGSVFLGECLRKLLLVLLAVFLVPATVGFADDAACVVLGTQDIHECNATAIAIDACGGRVRHTFPPSVLICDLNAEAESSIKSIPAVQMVSRSRVDVSSFPELSPNSRIGLDLWNSTFTIAAVTAHEALPTAPLPVNDALTAPDTQLSAQQFEIHGRTAIPGSYQTSEFMIGKIAVGIILPESIGGSENWSNGLPADRQSTVVSKIVDGMNWWLSNSDPSARLSFTYDIHLSVPCNSEPISSFSEGTWVSETMGSLGYTGSNNLGLVRHYINDIRQQNNTDWSFCVFVVDSLNDSNGCFSDQRFAFSYRMGPMAVLTYDCSTWGISRMDMVFRHEVGHIFGGADEYCNPRDHTATFSQSF